MLSKLNSVAQYLIKSFSFDSWKERENLPPDYLSFHLIDNCNANCVFCAKQYISPTGRPMDMDIFKKGLEQYISMGGKRIGFNPLVGEPLLDPYLFERINIVKSYRQIEELFLFTNGILLSKYAEKLVDSKIDKIVISLHGFNESMYRSIYRVNAYDKVIDGLEKLLIYNKRNNSQIDIVLSLKPYKPPFEVLSEPDFQSRVLPYLDEGKIEFVRALDRWGGLIEEQLLGRLFLADPPPFKNRPCAWLFAPVILRDGDIRICECRFGKEVEKDELIIGNINSKPLNEVWFSSVPKKVRRRFVKGDLPTVCKNCTMYIPA